MSQRRGSRYRRRGAGASLGVGAALALVLGSVLGCASTPKPVAAAPETDIAASARRSSAAERERVAVTVYNSNFALVREERKLALGTGRVALAFEDVSAHIEPYTVHLSSLDAPDALAVLEQNYRYDLLTPEKLLEKFVGRRLTVARYDESRGEDVRQEAELLGVQNGPVLRVDGQVTSGDGYRFIFPELPASLLERPTLVWLLDSGRAEQRVEVSYLTSDMSWSADYVLVLDAQDQTGDLSGWVTLDNRSGTSFLQAQLKLVAGDVHRAPPPAPPPEPEPAEEEGFQYRAAEKPTMVQEPLLEYHLYTLQRAADLLDKERKQVSLLEARGTQLQKRLVFRSFQGPGDNLGETEDLKPDVFITLENSEARGLGMPLPAGVMRVYKADASGAQQFVGEDSIKHTPRDEKLEIKLGQAFDVVANRRQTAWHPLGRCGDESEWEYEIRNHKDTPERVEVIETTYDVDLRVVRSSHPAEQRDASTVAFGLDVPARGTVKLTFEMRRAC